MSTVPNHALRQLRDGKLAHRHGAAPGAHRRHRAIAKTCGFDWLFIDCEHNSMDLDTAAQIAMASLPVGITPIVRVPGKEHYHASRMLDNGAQGIVVPHVDNVEEAERAATPAATRRSGTARHGRRLPQLAFAAMPVGEARASSTRRRWWS